MRRVVFHVITAIALVGLGWTAAQARRQGPDFEIAVVAPVGQTTVTCVRGCALKWVERTVNPDDSNAQSTFSFRCGGNWANCPSGRVGGWITH